MFIQTRLRAPKIFTKFHEYFVTTKRKNVQPSLGQTDCSEITYSHFVMLYSTLFAMNI